MSEELIYTLTDSGDSIVDKDIESMDEWLTIMDDITLAAFHRICNKNPEDRSDEEDYEICKFSLVLYCRELGLRELGITPEFLTKISGSFCANIILEPLRRGKMIEVDGPLLIYKDCKIKITDIGKDFIKKTNEKNSNS